MSTNGAFWTNHGTDPKRKYRFTVQINDSGAAGLNGVLWFAKTVDKPEITVNTGEVNYLSHKFYFPGTVEWNEVNLVLVDPIQPDAAANTLQILKDAGYLGPDNAFSSNPRTMSKLSPLEVVITQIDAKGGPQEKWTLKNAIVTKLGFGELDYSSEDLSEISMTFRYDWATCDIGASEFFSNQNQ